MGEVSQGRKHLKQLRRRNRVLSLGWYWGERVGKLGYW